MQVYHEEIASMYLPPDSENRYTPLAEPIPIIPGWVLCWVSGCHRYLLSRWERLFNEAIINGRLFFYLAKMVNIQDFVYDPKAE
jgi:hypothetical protein